MPMVVEPTCVQVTPSGEVKPVSVLPARTSRVQYGTAGPVVLAVVLVPLVAERVTKAAPLPGVRASRTERAPAASDSRIMTPALAEEAVFSTAVTRAVIDPSPVSGW